MESAALAGPEQISPGRAAEVPWRVTPRCDTAPCVTDFATCNRPGRRDIFRSRCASWRDDVSLRSARRALRRLITANGEAPVPATLTFPGVYIEEVPSGVRTISGVATSITAFVGYTARGLDHRAQRIFGLGDFERAFGGL